MPGFFDILLLKISAAFYAEANKNYEKIFQANFDTFFPKW